MNESLRKLLIRHEGWRNTPYKCARNFLTIGVGHNYTVNPLPKEMEEFLFDNGYLTNQMVEQLFQSDVLAATRDCKRLYKEFDSFSENRRNALIDFVFNVGYQTARSFIKTNKAINSGDWKLAAEGIRSSLYWKQLGGDTPGKDDGKCERPEEIVNMILEG